MPKFQYNKLIRDKISDLASQDGAQLDFFIISGKEKIDALKNKIIEESAEIIDAKTNEDLLDELVDLSTVIKSLFLCLSISNEQVDELKLLSIKNQIYGIETNINEQEKINILKNKIIEESAEIIDAKTDKNLLDELVYISSVIEELLSCLSISQEKFSELEVKKIEKRGGFEKGIYANSMTVNENHPRYEYFRSNPEKYPEIK